MTDSIQAPDFWQTACMATARHAVDVLRLANKPMTAGNVLALIETAPRSATEAKRTEPTEESFCRKCLDAAWELVQDEVNPDDLDDYCDAESHFLNVIPALRPATREQLEASFAGVIRGLRLLDRQLPPSNSSRKEWIRFAYGDV